jgi:signal transduction histidine kinase
VPINLTASTMVDTSPDTELEPTAIGSIEPHPRLLLRFALYTGVVLLGAGLAIAWLVNREVADRAGRTVAKQSRSIALSNLRSHLRISDFAAPVTPARRAVLDELFRHSTVPGVVNGGLVSANGTVTYSADHSRIGGKPRHPKIFAGALAGRISQRVTYRTSWRTGRSVKVLQILVPVRASISGRPIGLIGVDQNYSVVAVGTGDAATRLGVILAIALVLLYIALFPIMNRLTRQLAARNRRLHELAEERGRLFKGERAARAEAESVQRLLAEQNEQLRELDRLKDEFVSLVSHELRTPLTSIRGYVELLLEEKGQLDDDQRRFLEIVNRNSERLLALVADLLFLAQIDAGKPAIEFGKVDLNRIAEECVEASSPVADSKAIDLSLQARRLPRIEGDPARLAQVLDNLVSNALKFTPSGGTVEVRLRPEDGQAVLEVDDTGLGVPEEEQERLFERFFRSSSAMESAIPGTGLGLTITKAIVERHGGTIEVESAPNAGTTVRVRLPLKTKQRLDQPSREIAASAT